MSMSGHLVFDPTAPTLSDNANVGSYTRASNGDLIDDHTIATKNWLNVAAALFDGAGTALSSQLLNSLQLLNVYVGGMNGIYDASVNPNPSNVGVVGYSRNASPSITLETQLPTVGHPASVAAIQDSTVFAWDTNSYLSAWDVGTSRWVYLTDTNHALDVNIKSTSAAADEALANTAITAGATAVSSTVGVVVASPLTNRKYLYYMNNSKQAIFIGPATVTAANGFPLFNGGAIEMRAGAAVPVNVISASGSGLDSRYLELS